MNIFLIIIAYLILEGFTGLETIVISHNRLNKVIDKVGEKGYKVAYEEFKNFMQEEIAKEKKKSFKIINTILMLIPGLNIISGLLENKIITYKLFKDSRVKSSFIPLNKEEKKIYNNTKYLGKRVGNLTYFSSLNKKTKLEYDALPYKYRVEEVKKLNSCTEKYYKLGHLNGENIAIIGIPSLEEVTKNITLNGKEYCLEELPYNFEDAFIVYPFDFNYQTDEVLKTCMMNIRIKQIKQNDNKNISLNLQRQRVRKMN